MNRNTLFTYLLLCIVFVSCEKTDDLEPSKTGYIKLKFDHIASDRRLELGVDGYQNQHGETFSVETLKYFISNVGLRKDDGTDVVIPKDSSFRLIDAADIESLQPLFEVQEGNYTHLTFMLGIDSLTNTLPIEDRTGVLDPVSNGMYWSWNSGYIFFKMEGNSISAPNGRFMYHIGLFGGYDTPTVNNIKVITVDLRPAGTAQVRENLSADIHLMTDVGKVFDGVNPITISEHSMVMVNGPHSLIAENYSQMFVHDHTHNFQRIGQ